MNFNEYQSQARKTAIYPDINTKFGILYTTLGLSGESGEVSENIKKMLRDDNGNLTVQRYSAIVKELGDVLWYVSNISSELGADLEDIAQQNLDKLKSRQNRNMLHGSGDNR